MASPYEVAIHLTATNGVSSVLAAISKEVLGLTAGVKELEKGFSNLHLGVLGAAGVAAGLGGFMVLKDLAKHAADLSHELTQISKLGVSDAQLAVIRTAAQRTTEQVPGTTEKSALELYGVSYSMFGNDGALKIMEPLAKFVQVVGNTGGDYEGAQGNIVKMIRSGELMGKFINEQTKVVDTDKLMHFLDLGARVMTATHGMVNSATWLQLAQQGGPALAGMSDSGMYTMAIIAQAMGGYRAGTALSSIYQQMAGGKMAQYPASELHKMGLVGDYSVGKGGHLLWKDGALNTDFVKALKTDPIEATKIMVDAFHKQGLNTMDQIVPKMYEILQRTTSIRELHDLIRNLPQIIQERDRIQVGLGVDDAYAAQQGRDLEQVEHNLGASWQNLMYAIAGPSTGFYVGVLSTLSKAFTSLTASLHGVNPQAIANVFEGLAVVSAGLFAGGSLAIITAIAAALGPAGAVMAGLGALAAILGYFSSTASDGAVDFAKRHGRPNPTPDLFQTLGGWWKSLNDFDVRMRTAAQTAGANVGRWVSEAWSAVNSGQVSTAIARWAVSLVSDIGSALEQIPDLTGARIAGLASGMASAITNWFRDVIASVGKALGLPEGAINRKPLPPEVDAAVDAAYKRRAAAGSNEPSIQARDQHNLMDRAASIPVNLPPIQVQTTALPVTVRIEGDMAALFRMIGGKIESEIKTMVGFGQGNDATAMPGHVGGVGHQ